MEVEREASQEGPISRSTVTRYYRRTRRGKVLRICDESYLRLDLGFGSRAGRIMKSEDMAISLNVGDRTLSAKKDEVTAHWLIPDTNVILHQMDLLECSSCDALNHLIVLETVVEEVRHNNISIFRRLLKLLAHESKNVVFFANEHHQKSYVYRKIHESPNDRNDRAIRRATTWYNECLGHGSVIMLSNDQGNVDIASAENIPAKTMKQLVMKHSSSHPQLLDLLAFHAESDEEENFTDAPSDNSRRDSSVSSHVGSKAERPQIYHKHLSLSELMIGIKAGRYFQGILRCNRGHWDDCYVVVGGTEARERVSVAVTGAAYLNRAIEGDMVALEILPRDEWRGGNMSETAAMGSTKAEQTAARDEIKITSEADESQATPEDHGAAIADITAAPLPGDLENARRMTLSPNGRVVGIIQRNWRYYCGSLLVGAEEKVQRGSQTANVLVGPVDRRIPRIRIQTRQRDVLIGKRIIVAIDSWPTTSRYPWGHYVNTLGDTGDKTIETKVLLHEHNIPADDFSGDVLACLPPEDWEINDENSRGRRDLRHLPVMSIDPPGCRDIDDALHWRILPNGNWEVGIHIADVTHFVHPGTPLDLEAANRSTSTYLVDRRLDMLPKMLTEKLCSLVGNRDRFAFSVLLEVTPEAEIIEADFCKSIIHSIGAHTYGEAQAMLDDPARTDVKAESVRHLNRLAKLFRKRRMDAGALTLASPEVRFVLDTESQNPLDVQMYALKETNALVEEFMLLANITVGKKILRHFPTMSLLRRHPAPAKSQFLPLVSAAKAVGFDIHIEDSKRLADSLDAACRPADPYFNKLLRIMCTRCMAPAQYFSSGEQIQEDWHHYGLATPIYTHFTSPIRRYADVIVHRLLGAAIGVAPLPAQFNNKSSMHDLAENMNRRHRSAQLAGRASVSLYTKMYFRDNPAIEKAYVMAVYCEKVTVLVPRFGIEGTISLINNEEESKGVQYDETSHSITCNGHRVQVFHPVKVSISVDATATDQGSVKILMVDPPLGEQPSIEQRRPIELLEDRAKKKQRTDTY